MYDDRYWRRRPPAAPRRSRRRRSRAGGGRGEGGGEGGGFRAGRAAAPPPGASTKSTPPSAVRAQAAEGDGVAERIHGGNAVLPLGARGSAEQVRGTGLRRERVALPRRARLAPEPKDAG